MSFQQKKTYEDFSQRKKIQKSELLSAAYKSNFTKNEIFHLLIYLYRKVSIKGSKAVFFLSYSFTNNKENF